MYLFSCKCAIARRFYPRDPSLKEEEKEVYHTKSAIARRLLPKGPPLLGEEKKEHHVKSTFMASETKREKRERFSLGR